MEEQKLDEAIVNYSKTKSQTLSEIEALDNVETCLILFKKNRSLFHAYPNNYIPIASIFKHAPDDKIIQLLKLFLKHDAQLQFLNLSDISLLIRKYNYETTYQIIMLTIKNKFYRRYLKSHYRDRNLSNKILKYLFTSDEPIADYLLLFIEIYDDEDIIDLYKENINKIFNGFGSTELFGDILSQIFSLSNKHSYQMLQILLETFVAHKYKIQNGFVRKILYEFNISDKTSSEISINKMRIFVDHSLNVDKIIQDNEIINILCMKYLRKKVEKTFDVLIELKFYPIKLAPYVSSDPEFLNIIIHILTHKTKILVERNEQLCKILNHEVEMFDVDLSSSDLQDRVETLMEYEKILLDQNLLLEQALLYKPGGERYQQSQINFKSLVKDQKID